MAASRIGFCTVVRRHGMDCQLETAARLTAMIAFALRLRPLILLLCALVGCTRKEPPAAAAAAPPATTPPASSPLPAAPTVKSDDDEAANADGDAAAPSIYKGRVLAQPIGPAGIGWLDRNARASVQKPEHVLDVLGVAAGQVVADVGCGSGYFTTHIASRVGPTGKVYATDIQQEMLAALDRKIAAQRLSNVVPVLATRDDAKLPKATFDLVLMVDVYHELQKPAATLAQARAALKPSGRLALVEYRGEDPTLEIRPEHKMTLEQIKKELTANGFTFVANDESLPQQHIVTFAP